ncbi:MAG: hypothetical protein F6K42_34120, partial [Leptolyngbya sp. SIO1D8]|nr:hypothetical protein [Leptolyngbya sp. SIO1D8]
EALPVLAGHYEGPQRRTAPLQTLKAATHSKHSAGQACHQPIAAQTSVKIGGLSTLKFTEAIAGLATKAISFILIAPLKL